MKRLLFILLLLPSMSIGQEVTTNNQLPQQFFNNNQPHNEWTCTDPTHNHGNNIGAMVNGDFMMHPGVSLADDVGMSEAQIQNGWESELGADIWHWNTSTSTTTMTQTITDNLGNVWNGSVNVLLNAPVLDHTTFIVDDVASGNGNGKLDAGETLDLIVNVTNIGHTEIANLTATLGSLSSYVSVNSATSNISALSVNQQQSTTFNISIAANTPIGTYAEFPFDISDGIYTHNNIFILPFSFLLDSFSLDVGWPFNLTNNIDYYCYSIQDFKGEKDIKYENIPDLCEKFKIEKNLINPIY